MRCLFAEPSHTLRYCLFACPLCVRRHKSANRADSPGIKGPLLSYPQCNFNCKEMDDARPQIVPKDCRWIAVTLAVEDVGLTVHEYSGVNCTQKLLNSPIC
jgi:hypothetical protein